MQNVGHVEEQDIWLQVALTKPAKDPPEEVRVVVGVEEVREEDLIEDLTEEEEEEAMDPPRKGRAQ